jgi:membrane protein YdbS with pleckstrin-like domain
MNHPDGPAALLQREPAHRVSPRARVMWTISEAISGVISIAAGVFLWSRDWIPTPWNIGLLVVIVLRAVGATLIVPQWRYRVHRWEITADAVYTQHGWINQERRVAPITRIQTVDTERGPLAQLMKLSTVTITTASAKGALKIAGLERADADRIVHELTTIAAADGGDGT